MSCGDSSFTQTTFDSSFPKRNRNLSNILGDELSIKSGNDTLTFKIVSDRNNNLITNSKNGDTLFYGKVSSFRGLYYFTSKHSDTSYSIYTVKISDSLIYGLTTGWVQGMYVSEEIKNGNNPKLVKYINSDSSIIKLHTNKFEMKKMFGSLISKFEPDTILYFKDRELQETSRLVKANDYEKGLDYISKVYPNPTKNILHVDLQQKENTSFQLTDLNGKLVVQGQLNELQNKIDLTKQQAGIYTLTVTNTVDREKESIKIMKID